MLENRNLKKDLFAIGLLAGVVFLGVSLVTYSPADPIGAADSPLSLAYSPDHLVLPANESISNLCGYWGACIADAMLTSLGAGAYFVVFSLAWVDVILLRRQGLQTPWLRSIGWVITLIGMTSIFSLVIPNLSPGPVVGPGGYLGALTSGLLRTQFATFGAVVLSTSVLVCGLLLYTDYGILRFMRMAVVLPAIATVTSREWLRTKLRIYRPETVATDVEDEELLDEEEGEEESEPAIKILGRTSSKVDEDEAEEEEHADEEIDEEEEYEEEVDAEADSEVAEEDEEEELVVKALGNKAQEKKSVHSQPHFKVKKPEKSDREEVMTQLNAASQGDLMQDYELPDLEMLRETEDFSYDEQEKEVRIKAKILEKTFAEFGFKVRVVEIETGPVIAQYEIQLEAGLRLSKITGLADDLAIALRVPSVRIVAPIPGKNTVGIEVPNEARQVVRLREVMELTDAKTRKMKIPLFLGKDVSGNPLTADLAALPHLLIAGRTGTGKSVCLNAIISSILMTRRPDEVRMLMIDPKMVELSGYARLPHLMHPVVTDMKKAEAILAWAVDKMEERYSLLAQAGVRHISSYNQLGEEELMRRLQIEDEDERANVPLHLPFIVIVADEMADLMMTAGKEVEQHIIRLAQKSRAVGIHLILATQKPTVDVITGLIKSNLPARISFQVASRTDSRVVLDEMGADKLLGNGDMLFLWPGTSTLLRGQGTYLDDEEIDAITNEVSTGEQNFVNELVNLKVESDGEGGEDRFAELKKRDDLYESAIDIVVREGRGSVSLLQRTLGIGYGRAARLIDFMAEDNIVGPYAGSQAREVLVTYEEWESMQGLTSEPEAAPTPPVRSNRIVPDHEEEVVDDELNDDEMNDDDEEEVVDEYEEEVDEEDDIDAQMSEDQTEPGRTWSIAGSDDEDDGDDEGGAPLKPPHWGEDASTGRIPKSKSKRRKRKVKATSGASMQAPWEGETSDWKMESEVEDDEDDDVVDDYEERVPTKRTPSMRRNRFKVVDVEDEQFEESYEDDEEESLDASLETDDEYEDEVIPVKASKSGKRTRFDEADLKLAAPDLEEEEEVEHEDEEYDEEEYEEEEYDEDEVEDADELEVGDEVDEEDDEEVDEEVDEDEDEDEDYDFEYEGDEEYEEEYEEDVEGEEGEEVEEDGEEEGEEEEYQD